MQTTFCIANKTIKSTSGIEKLQEMSHIAYIKVKMNDNEDRKGYCELLINKYKENINRR